MQDNRKKMYLCNTLLCSSLEVVGTEEANRLSKPYFPICLAGQMGFFVPHILYCHKF